jgi:glycosyltransferase involved in cell wall biosynthesis
MGRVLSGSDEVGIGLLQRRMSKLRVLYISYDGLMEPLGNSQVFQYLKKLAPGKTIFLLTYEKFTDLKDLTRRELVAEEARQAGIQWLPLRYHKRPTSLATGYDVLVGLAVSLYLAGRYRIEIVHARSYVSAMIALALKRLIGTKFIFDMRGFWPDERVESGAWSKSSYLYRIAKRFERRLLLGADAVVSLTHAGVSEMRKFQYLQRRQPAFYVITTCTNLELFHTPKPFDTRKSSFTVGYVGGARLWYDFDAAVDCFKYIFELRPAARIVIVNREEHEYVRECLRRRGLDGAEIEIKRVEYSEMAAEMRRMHAAIFFIRPTFSKLASAPTKLGELLASGVPCLTNAGVGDLDRILRDNNAGIVVEETGQDALMDGVRKLLKIADSPDIAVHCRAAAVRHFSLYEGALAYDRIYSSLTTKGKESLVASTTGLADD